ncbi:hypothetical protein AruPA_20975 [Acidiphilium sp. PA]|uniref:hypothetical protein n=1 Tax=Acidiphilium sp. PA TaxID=2871705 RepID=UPI0022447F54|nr:hypothetical protein [Acidiphilium sp. PA]MCW8309492.1 hypothetical protein [Acidiphilium sp. PA]
MNGPELSVDALGKGTGTRAPALLWMIDHHDELLALIRRHRINWTYVTERLTEAGFRDAADNPLKPRTVRSYWERARKYVANNPPDPVIPTPSPSSSPASSPSPAPPPASAPAPSRSGFDPIEPEIVAGDLFDKPLPTIRLRHQQSKSGIVATAERSANDANAALASVRAKPTPAKE